VVERRRWVGGGVCRVGEGEEEELVQVVREGEAKR
jgi:hypothetical protein